MARYRGARKAPAYVFGHLTCYSEASDSCSIVSFLRRASRPAISTLDSHNMTSFTSVDDVVFVAHLAPQAANLRQRFEKMAEEYADRHSFGIVTVPDSHGSAINCYNNVDDRQHAMDNLDSVRALKDFIVRCSTFLVPQMTRRNELGYLRVSSLSRSRVFTK